MVSATDDAVSGSSEARHQMTAGASVATSRGDFGLVVRGGHALQQGAGDRVDDPVSEQLDLQDVWVVGSQQAGTRRAPPGVSVCAVCGSRTWSTAISIRTHRPRVSLRGRHVPTAGDGPLASGRQGGRVGEDVDGRVVIDQEGSVVRVRAGAGVRYAVPTGSGAPPGTRMVASRRGAEGSAGETYTVAEVPAGVLAGGARAK